MIKMGYFRYRYNKSFFWIMSFLLTDNEDIF